MVPRINPEIWRYMGRGTRAQDGEWRKLQSMVTKALTRVVVVIDCVKKLDTKEACKGLADTIKVLAMLYSNISTKRKDAISNDMAPSFRPLCTASRPVTTWLFGDDLQKDIKDISESYRIGAKASSSSYGRFPFRGRGGHRGRGQYLDAGRGQRGRGCEPGQFPELSRASGPPQRRHRAWPAGGGRPGC